LNKSLTKVDDEGNEVQIDISEEKKETKPYLQEILKICQTDMERKVCELYLKNPNISQEKIAQKLGTYKMDISRIVNRLRKKLKIFVTKQ
jgi:DNA-directed RNA polymerase specialized sigma subunit